MKDFVAAVQEETAEVEEGRSVTFNHEGREVTFYEPDTGQLSIMLAISGSDMDVNNAGAFIQMFFEMMDSDTQKYFRSRLLNRNDKFNLDGENGIVAIFTALTEEWSGKAMKQPSDFQQPQSVTGAKSTANTPARRSTSSRSRSTGSST